MGRIDCEKAKIAGVKGEANRDNRQAGDYKANVARFEEPFSENTANLHAMLADIESRFLVP